MTTRKDGELRFVQIATSSTIEAGYERENLYGLTKDGRVFYWQQDTSTWFHGWLEMDMGEAFKKAPKPAKPPEPKP